MSDLTASVIVRAKDKESTIGDTLRSLRAQTVPMQIVVVDSGSIDRTVEIARSFDVDVIEIPASSFTYGRALNVGARHATGDVLFALSAHCTLPGKRWAEWSLLAYDDPSVALTVGHHLDPGGRRISAPVTLGALDLDLEHNPSWGMSNHASSWRRRVWDGFAFNETLSACEDKEWMWRALGAGYSLVVDPRLAVDSKHRWAEGTGALYRRVFKEYAALAALVDFEPPGVRDVLSCWWAAARYTHQRPAWQRRLSPRRNAELVAEYRGSHAGERGRGPGTIACATWHASCTRTDPLEVNDEVEA